MSTEIVVEKQYEGHVYLIPTKMVPAWDSQIMYLMYLIGPTLEKFHSSFLLTWADCMVQQMRRLRVGDVVEVKLAQSSHTTYMGAVSSLRPNGGRKVVWEADADKKLQVGMRLEFHADDERGGRDDFSAYLRGAKKPNGYEISLEDSTNSV